MPMSYSTLVASKGTSGAVATWVRYSDKVLDIPVIVDEAQFLLYQILRVREMRTVFTFEIPVGGAAIALPTRFLDPVGDVQDVTNVTCYRQRLQTDILTRRAYDTSLSGNLGTNPFTTTLGSGLVSVNLNAHGLNQGSVFNPAGAVATNGLALNGAFVVTAITDANNFMINVGDATDSQATASGADGGAAVTYTASNLIAGSPSIWGIWDEMIHFDMALDTAMSCRLPFFRQPKLLAKTTNETNFVTNRYPKLMRIACQASAADFMRDTDEYNKQVQALNNLITTTAAMDDLSYRGADIGTETP